MAYRIDGLEIPFAMWCQEMEQIALEDRRERCPKVVSRDVVRGDAEPSDPPAASGD